ncbi:hypothetical protein HDA40_006961 [Hamadaea flava]|uniref:Uncharacterized protein n=1 Tax=Hamadaea flava TaxID=1742688 RepID=A0ABV8M2Y0_9ACTN|nr:hypothetical protein [Hamadaea flava]MCP2328454.1 hypothetical protein [Hamadaea flava]
MPSWRPRENLDGVDLTDTQSTLVVVCALAILVGTVGVVVPNTGM